VLAAAAGSGLGISGLLTYTAGIFGKSLGIAIGLSRTSLGLAFFLATAALALALPVAGWLIDRLGPRLPAAVGAILLSLGFMALGTLVHDVSGFIFAMTVIGLIAACSAPVAYTRAVSMAFVRSRGLALGITQVGIGLSAMLVPPLLGNVIGSGGWQRGYLVLAALAFCGVFPALALPHGKGPERAHSSGAGAAMRSPTFLLLLAAFGLMALSFAGLLTHFVPLLSESGMSLPSAARAAGLIGASVIVSRIIVGWLADRVDATKIAAASCVICASGCLVLAWGGAETAWAGAIALGAAMGAEADLIGFLTARYFRLEEYGRLYAVQYASFMLMAGLSPLWIGLLADRAGGYTPALIVTAFGLSTAALLFLRLPSTRAAPDLH
jgi:MFS family permease